MTGGSGATGGDTAEAGLAVTLHGDIAVARLVVSRLRSNCYLLRCRGTGETIVVDAGDEGERILLALDRLTGGRRELVRAIVNTHGHVDHTAAVADLRAALGPVPVVMHPLDVELVEGNGPDARDYLRREYEPVPPDRLVREGDTIGFGRCALRVIETPGHSPGGLCLQGAGLLFSGDTLFRRGIGRPDGFKGDRAALLDSLRRKLLSLPDETIVYPGHGEATTIGEERAENPYASAE